tara:strand:- start:4971 stop:7241 length:2271 start_codon:yes stop_codon:yes gene_type:complete
MSKFIIEVRTRGFGKAEQELKQASSQTRKFARNANDAKDAGAVFRKEVSQLRNNMLLYTFAIGGAIAGMGRFVMAASDAREQASKFRVVFGEFAPEADAFAQSITDSFGIAKSEMITLLARLQDTFVPLGFSREQATELSKSIAQLSMDVGSFNNVATGDVAARFTSAIIGNHEAVRELGINLTEASLKQEAQTLGLIKAGEQMGQTEKILSRINTLFKNTTDAQGDAIRTQDEFAAQLRAVSGRFTTLTENIGEAILPTAEFGLKLANIFTDGDRAAIVIGGITIALVNYNKASLIAAANTLRFNQALSGNALIATGTAFLVAIDLAMDKIEELGRNSVQAAFDIEELNNPVQNLIDANVSLTEGLEEQAKAEKALQEARQKSIDSIKQSETALAIRLAVMLEETELGKARVTALLGENRILTDREIKILAEIDRIKAQNEANRESIRVAKENADADAKAKAQAIRLAKENADADAEANKRLIDRKNKLAEAETRLAIVQAKSIENNDLQVKKMTIVDNAIKELADELGGPDGLGIQYSDLKDKIGNSTEALSLQMFDLEIMTDAQRELAQTIIDTANAQMFLEEKTNDASKSIEFNASAAANAINSMTSAIRVLKDESADEDQRLKNLVQLFGSLAAQFGGPKGAVAGAVLNLGAEVAFGHTGGLIRNNGIQRFATGGMVQGQDNVPIMAQAGEFIMRRDAVQNIGVENLAQMNRSGSAGGVTINIQGNMIGNDEFVRDNLIPQLKEVSNQDLA